jgi:hypothetical protein
MITLHNRVLEGKNIAFNSNTEFVVQVGKGAKGGYKTKAAFRGATGFGLAVTFYNALNIGLGYKKRLIMPSDRQGQLRLGFMPKTVRQTKSTILAQASS